MVETIGGGRYRAPAVQISAGAWAGEMAARLGETVPFAVHGPQMAVTEPLPYRIEPSIGVYSRDRTDAVYLRQVTRGNRSEEHTSELQSLMRISYAVFCLKKNKKTQHT